jgi:hypothetical protein
MIRPARRLVDGSFAPTASSLTTPKGKDQAVPKSRRLAGHWLGMRIGRPTRRHRRRPVLAHPCAKARSLETPPTNADGVQAEGSPRLAVFALRPDDTRVKGMNVVRGPAQRSTDGVSERAANRWVERPKRADRFRMSISPHGPRRPCGRSFGSRAGVGHPPRKES